MGGGGGATLEDVAGVRDFSGKKYIIPKVVQFLKHGERKCDFEICAVCERGG